MSAMSGASMRLGFSVPSMNPVRSRSWWYGELDVAVRRRAEGEDAGLRADRGGVDKADGKPGYLAERLISRVPATPAKARISTATPYQSAASWSPTRVTA